MFKQKYFITKFIIFVMCLAVIAFMVVSASSCTTRQCYTNGGKPIKETSRQSVKRWKNIKS